MKGLVINSRKTLSLQEREERAAMLKVRFADIIKKAHQGTLYGYSPNKKEYKAVGTSLLLAVKPTTFAKKQQHKKYTKRKSDKLEVQKLLEEATQDILDKFAKLSVHGPRAGEVCTQEVLQKMVQTLDKFTYQLQNLRLYDKLYL